jgi:anti-sigma factor RsiW
VSAGRLDEMSCRELVQVITDYLEGTMRPDDRARFEAHLEECAYCVAYVEQMRETIAALGELREDSLPAAMRTQLVEAFRGWVARPAGRE